MQSDRQSSWWRRGLGLLGRLVFGLSMIALMASGIFWLHARADSEEATAERDPLPVITRPVELVDVYSVNQRFAGRLEPARKTDIAFERAGLILDIAIDEGAAVDAGEAVAWLDTELLEAEKRALEAERTQAQADRQLAINTLERQQTLAGQGHASQQRLDEARFAVDGVVGRIANLDAQIRRIEIDIEKSVLRAPFAGTVAARWRDEGAVIDAGVAILTILESGRPEARIGVPPQVADELERGQTYTLITARGPVEAILESLRPDLTMATRTVEARFRLRDAAPVPFGDLLRLERVREVEERGAWVPLSALLEGESGLWMLLTVVEGEAGSVVGSEAVQVLHVADERAFVQGTLGDGASIITEGVNRITPGQAVRARPAADNPGELLAQEG